MKMVWSSGIITVRRRSGKGARKGKQFQKKKKVRRLYPISRLTLKPQGPRCCGVKKKDKSINVTEQRVQK